MNILKKLSPSTRLEESVGYRYIVNNFGKEVVIPDIRRRLPNEPNTVFMISEEDYKKSDSIKANIRAGMLSDVTSDVIKNFDSLRNAISNSLSRKEIEESITRERKPANDDNKGFKLVDELDYSRALSGSDREERLRNINKSERRYETDGIFPKEEKKGGPEFKLTESDSRGNSPNNIDPRMARKPSNQSVDILSNIRNSSYKEQYVEEQPSFELNPVLESILKTDKKLSKNLGVSVKEEVFNENSIENLTINPLDVVNSVTSKKAPKKKEKTEEKPKAEAKKALTKNPQKAKKTPSRKPL
jgi:hypothetical protein